MHITAFPNRLGTGDGNLAHIDVLCVPQGCATGLAHRDLDKHGALRMPEGIAQVEVRM